MTPTQQGTARAGVAGPRAGITSPRRPAPAPDRPRHLEVVRGRPAPGRRPPRALVFTSVGLIAGIVLVIVVARVLTGQAGFTETDVTKRISQHQREIEDLQLQIARLRAPQRIHARALELGLVPATHVVYLTPSPRAASSPAPNARVPSSNPSGAPGRGGR